ncbi:MAG: TRAP transporter substrate-binding protein DctP [Proteobacteria bacterium]|nr:TRAP transporter substrate-binding protein DctP [Pseudomonadota bacterium]
MKTRTILAAIFALCVLAPGVARAGEESGAAAVWKIGTLAPKGAGWARHANEYIIQETIRQTDGKIRPQVFWGGVAGDDEDYLELMREGKLQGAGLSGQGAALACPEFSVVELPFLFTGYPEVDLVRKRFFARFDALFAAYGLKLLYWLDQDFDQMYSAKSPMTRLEDFSGTRFVLWYGPLEENLFEVLDAEWTALNVPDSARALRSGEADSVVGPAQWVLAAQLGPVMRYVNPQPVRYSPVVVVICLDAWKRMPQRYKDIQEKNREGTQERFTADVRRDNQRSLDALLAYGVKEAQWEPEELERFRARATAVYGQMANILYPAELLGEIQGLLAAHRAGAEKAPGPGENPRAPLP